MAGTYEKTSSSVQEQFHSQVIPFPDTFSQKNHETENSFLFLFSWHFLFLFRQIPLFSISVSPFASKSFNNVCIVIAMIIVYKLFSQLHLITNLEVFRLRTIYLRTHFMWRKFFWLIEIKKNDIQVFFSEKSTGSILPPMFIWWYDSINQPVNFNCSHGFYFEAIYSVGSVSDLGIFLFTRRVALKRQCWQASLSFKRGYHSNMASGSDESGPINHHAVNT